MPSRRPHKSGTGPPRIANNKAADPAGRILRDLLMPLILPRLANREQSRQTYGYHIDWAV
ncbi:hypothetical protein [Streptomyces sp. NPDC088812]|uniref:hypothetical protein n=1 Tax=Streptomyces sp. NPDC088812 TaxID=3365905 RepID=UPI003801414D